MVSAVSPLLFVVLSGARASMSILVQSTWPLFAARMSGVSPACDRARARVRALYAHAVWEVAVRARAGTAHQVLGLWRRTELQELAERSDVAP
jgi:hypothetical protein